MIYEKDHICVCICTYKRPEMLLRLLSELEEQETENLFNYSIVIVDNDKLESARQPLKSIALKSKLHIQYFVEMEQNISLARNKALQNYEGNFIAMIDDDEYPSKTWLLNLFNVFNTFKPNGGVLGPVIPFYPEGTPKWLIKSKICDRPNYPTGTKLDWNMTRGGNAILSHNIFHKGPFLFDPKLGRNGGEDKEFFKRIIDHGYSFIWCREAEVNEIVYPGRWKLSHYLYRAILNGGDAGKEHGIKSFYFLIKSIISFLYYSVLLLCTVFMGKHYTYKYFIKVVYDFARIMGCFNIAFITVRHE